MKIGIISRSVYPIHGFGGAEKHVYYIAEGLAEKGHEIHLFCLEAKNASEEDYKEIKHKNLHLHELKYIDLGLGRLNFIQFAYKLRRKWEELNDMDIVHSSSLFAGSWFSFFKEVPEVVTTHGLEEFMHLKLKLPLAPLNLIDKIAAQKNVDKFIALSEGNREDIKKHLGVQNSKIVDIPNGVDSDFFQPTETEELESKFDLKNNVVVAVSRLVEYKGHGLLVEAVNEMDDTSLIVVGKGPYKEKLEEKAGEDVYFTGLVSEEDLPKYYSLGDVFPLPTFGEGLPLSILESMSCGTPVLSTKVGSIPDVIDKKVGKLVEPRDKEALKKGLKDLLSDKNKLKKMGSASRERAVEKYSWGAVVKRTEEVYKDLTS